MRTISLIATAMFDVAIEGAPATVDDILPGWHLHDGRGLVIDEPLGGLGASHLVQRAITSFYGAAEWRRGTLSVDPESYSQAMGSHGRHNGTE